MKNDYASWYVEFHPFEIGFEVSRLIASHMVMRIAMGNVVVVCDSPHNWHSTFRKRWLAVIRSLERERSSVINKESKAEISHLIRKLEQTKFLTILPNANVQFHQPTVWLAHPDSLVHIPEGVETVYVMTDLTHQQLTFWNKQLKDGGALVLFRKQPISQA